MRLVAEGRWYSDLHVYELMKLLLWQDAEFPMCKTIVEAYWAPLKHKCLAGLQMQVYMWSSDESRLNTVVEDNIRWTSGLSGPNVHGQEWMQTFGFCFDILLASGIFIFIFWIL